MTGLLGAGPQGTRWQMGATGDRWQRGTDTSAPSQPFSPHCPTVAATTNDHKPSGLKPHTKEFSPSPEGQKSKIRVLRGRVRPQVSGEGPACIAPTSAPCSPRLSRALSQDTDGSLTQDDLTEGPFGPSAKALSPWEVTVQVPGASLSTPGNGGRWGGGDLPSPWVLDSAARSVLADRPGA